MRRRVLNGLGLLACAAMLAYAWYAQAVLGLEPCPLCIFQRIGIGACAVLFLLATLQNPARIGARIYGAALLLAAGEPIASVQKRDKPRAAVSI